ncbi:phage tail protein [Methyloraptor flagellatus]|uniref:Tail fiber protein n=1 Tax=Methyloraptor flagellatus TaxID=3162530 RepID=A0AAU7XF20_9HYPH
MQPFIGTIMPVAFGYAPKGWALCDGQTMLIQQNQALFSLIGTYFGGDGVRTFMLPDLRGRAAAGLAAAFPGLVYGADTVTLTTAEIPAHTHNLVATTAQSSASRAVVPTDKIFATPNSPTQSIFGSPVSEVALADSVNVIPMGVGLAHNNMQPFTVLNFIIALQGIYPSRS